MRDPALRLQVGVRRGNGAIRGEKALLQCALVAAIGVVYLRSAAFGFVALDDAGYVAQNPHVLNGLTLDGVAWALKTTALGNWHPLTWLSLMVDAAIGGRSPAVFHLTNLLLHAGNTLLLFHLLAASTGLVRRAAVVAGLFAIHPLHVESVAWVSERKDVLCALFGLLALVAYRRYAERPGLGRYSLVGGALALGLTAKPMLVSVPVLLLLMDYWPLGRFRRGASRGASGSSTLVLEKLPLVALSVAAGATTIWAQAHERAVVSLESIPMGARVANAIVSCAWYLGKTFWPSGLAASYPYAPSGPSVPMAVASAAFLLAISALVLRQARSRPYLLTGWVWYLVSLGPVIGLVQVGIQPRADRYTYLPLVGPLIMLVWGGADLLGKVATSRARRLAVAAGAAAMAVALMAAAFVQVGYWKGTRELFTHAIAVSPGSAAAHDGLGFELLGAGQVREALAHFEEAVRIMPEYPEAHVNFGAALALSGRRDESLAQYREAVRLRPGDPKLVARLGSALVLEGSVEEGAAKLRNAVEADPDDGNALKLLGTALARLGREEEAVARLRQAVLLLPGDAELRVSLGVLLLARRDAAEAEAQFRDALRIAPGDAAAHRNLGVVLAKEGRYPEAIAHLEAALRADPSNEGARLNLERARRMAGGSP
ncbi:MAG: tetratricopeptide repeat protein [Acidobacteriia bacterium]|nr:tetratricopeptide repeat protein [Terriglobia bacterium]